MKYSLYTIYDMDTEECCPVFSCSTEAHAIRQFCMSLKDAPEVYRSRVQLQYVGDFQFGCLYPYCLATGEPSFKVVMLGTDISNWFAEREEVVKPEVKNG